MPSAPGHPLGSHVEIGWWLIRAAWGKGYATEAARAALEDALSRRGFREILAYTAADNARSLAVMTRLGLRRDSSRDFDLLHGDMPWHGLVWVAEMRHALTQA